MSTLMRALEALLAERATVRRQEQALVAAISQAVAPLGYAVVRVSVAARASAPTASALYQRGHVAKKRARGLCIWGGCHAPLFSTAFCRTHLLAQRHRNRVLRGGRPWRPGGRGTVPLERRRNGTPTP